MGNCPELREDKNLSKVTEPGGGEGIRIQTDLTLNTMLCGQRA